jgi:hypothetical protein
VWTEEVLVTSKEACRPENFSRYLVFCCPLLWIVELFANLENGDD